MSNKLKDIFSDKMFDLEGEIEFHDNESYKKFFEALQLAQNEGKVVKLEESYSININCKDNKNTYPILSEQKIDHIIIEPSTKDIVIQLNTKYGEKKVLLKRHYTKNEIIFETDKSEVVYFKIVLKKDSLNNTFNFTCRIQPQPAKTIKDIVEGYNTAITFLEKIFKYEDSQDTFKKYSQIYDMRENFLKIEKFFEKLYLVEQEFKLSFEPIKINNEENNVEKLEELYWLIVEKKVIRLNAKLNAVDSSLIVSETQRLKEGSEIDLTFLKELKYTIYDKEISIYTVNFLFHAIIKEIRKEKDNVIKVLYGDIDSQPMYISYTGFKTSDKAEQEMNKIMDHKEDYRNALTVNEYMKNSNIIQ